MNGSKNDWSPKSLEIAESESLINARLLLQFGGSTRCHFHLHLFTGGLADDEGWCLA